MNQQNILIVDDDINIRNGLKRTLEPLGYRIVLAENGFSALGLLESEPVQLALLDIKMAGMDGRELFQKIREKQPGLSIIMITAYATIEDAIQFIKQGAYDYLAKPFDVEKVIAKINDALEKNRLMKQIRALESRLGEPAAFSGMVGKNPAMRKIYDLVDRIAESDAHVLLGGETGTGKDLLAKAIHGQSLRRDKPFVKVDCASLAPSLLESELFGHEKGAFTGAVAQKIGRFEMADNGTVFLDEVSNMEVSLQVKLLRVLQDSEFERVGGSRTIRVNIRLISATNTCLEKLVEANRFRKDLYYRLKGVSLCLPPLRERKEDIPLLAMHFFRRFHEKSKNSLEGFTQAALEKLMKYAWPGNIRELENCVEQAVLICRHKRIEPADIPLQSNGLEYEPLDKSLDEALSEMEFKMISEALHKTNGNIESAAKILKTNRTTLYSKLKKFGISTDHIAKIRQA